MRFSLELSSVQKLLGSLLDGCVSMNERTPVAALLLMTVASFPQHFADVHFSCCGLDQGGPSSIPSIGFASADLPRASGAGITL